MKTVQEVYDAYRIMPNLQLHQLRVAAVGKMICDGYRGELDRHSVLLACLFHDMGNIVKFDLKYFPEFLEPEGFDHWNAVRNGFIEKYGPEQHAANRAIAEELSLPAAVIRCIESVSFSNIEQTRDAGSIEQKICEYSDLRVSPHGIRPMLERIADIEKRYRDRRHGEKDHIAELTAAAQTIEQELFSLCSISPSSITEESAAPLIDELRQYQIA